MRAERRLKYGELGELIIQSVISGLKDKRRDRKDWYDFETYKGARLEVKFCQRKTNGSFSWENILGAANNKRFDRLILIGQRMDLEGKLSFFDVPYPEARKIVDRQSRSSIQYSFERLFRYRIEPAELQQRYGDPNLSPSFSLTEVLVAYRDEASRGDFGEELIKRILPSLRRPLSKNASYDFITYRGDKLEIKYASTHRSRNFHWMGIRRNEDSDRTLLIADLGEGKFKFFDLPRELALALACGSRYNNGHISYTESIIDSDHSLRKQTLLDHERTIRELQRTYEPNIDNEYYMPQERLPEYIDDEERQYLHSAFNIYYAHTSDQPLRRLTFINSNSRMPDLRQMKNPKYRLIRKRKK
jgi:hypothetical protein